MPDNVSNGNLPRPGGRGALLGLLLGVAVIAALVLIGGRQDVFDVLAATDRPLLTGALALSLLGLALKFGRWHYYITRVGAAVSAWRSVVIFGTGLSMTITPGRVGEVIRCGYLRQATGVSTAVTAPILIAERVTDGLGMFTVGSASLLATILSNPSRPLHPLAIPGLLVGLTATALSFVALRQTWARQLSLCLVDRIRPLSRYRSAVSQFWSTTTSLLGNEVMFPASALGIGAWAAWCGTLYLVLRAVGILLSPWRVMLVLSMSTLFGSLTLLPAGLVATDASLILFLGQSGVPASRAVAATLIYRVLTLWVTVCVGAAAMMLSSLRSPLGSGTGTRRS